MPSSQIFAVNNLGRVFSLATDQSVWRELDYLGLEFKRVCAHETVLWALGGDHQIYVYVYGSSVPIRVCEQVYENQRWNPIEGFTDQLLPSDRAVFSSEDGLTATPLYSITLPTLAWSWESPWHIHDTFNGHALDKEGWTYAIDFPRTYSAEKRWNSCVRRRKWVRYRRYVALDTWSAVPTIFQDATQEPFIDISVGGGEVPGEDPDKLMVWAVTALGRVMVRDGVDGSCPEGSDWLHIITPNDTDVTCISVSRNGRVWAVTAHGNLLVRTGIDRDKPTGTGWVKVNAPGKNSGIQYVSVGIRVVWAVTRDHHIWFRRGLDGSCDPRDVDTGNAWLHMVGSLITISVGPNDQVWGVTADDYNVVVRTGVTETELTGKTWRQICLPLGFASPSPTPSHSGSDSPCPSIKAGQSDTSLYRDQTTPTTTSTAIGITSLSPAPSPSDPDSLCSSIKAGQSHSSLCHDQNNLTTTTTAIDNIDLNELENVLSKMSMRENETRETRVNETNEASGTNEANKTNEASGTNEANETNEARFETNEARFEMNEGVNETNETNKANETNEERLQTREGIAGIEVNETNEARFETNETNETNKGLSTPQLNTPQSNTNTPQLDTPQFGSPQLYSLQSTIGTPQSNTSTPQLSIEWSETRLRHFSSSSSGSEASRFRAGVVARDDDGPQYPVLPVPVDHMWLWVTGGGCWVSALHFPKWFSSDLSPVKEPWRQELLTRLRERNGKVDPFSGYEEAVEGSSWVISGQCRWWAGGQWIPAALELILTGSRRSEIQDAELIARYALGAPKVEELKCAEILLSVLVVEVGRSLIALYQASSPLKPLMLSFTQEMDAEEWLSNIAQSCNQLRGVIGRASQYTTWGITTQGDVYLHDASTVERQLRLESQSGHKQLDIGTGKTPIVLPLNRGFRPGCFISATLSIPKSSIKFHINLQQCNKKVESTALHINPRFEQGCVVLNSRQKGVWGAEKHEDLGAIIRGGVCEISIFCDDTDFKISVNDKYWCSIAHRVPVHTINQVAIVDDVRVTSLTYDHGAGERELCDWYWRGIGGHMKHVEGGASGTTWAISNDNHVYIYSGAPGGGVYKGTGCTTDGLGVTQQSDTKHMYSWENQRWNPVTGFTNHGLPTDRHTWSDASGRHQRTRESIRLPSRHWMWTSEWCVDHHTPGGVDREGWQYATDFPLTYHPHRYVTDLVRRRRWVRKCRIMTSGPWVMLEKVALLHVSVSPEVASDGTVPVWGVSATGEVVIREGVRPEWGQGIRTNEAAIRTNEVVRITAEGNRTNEAVIGTNEAIRTTAEGNRSSMEVNRTSGTSPGSAMGNRWTLVPSECPMKSVCAGIGASNVWAVSRDGRAHLRLGVTPSNPKGTQWVNVDSPGAPLTYVGAGAGKVWGLDTSGNIFRRLQVHPLFPEGTGWEWVASDVKNISVSSDGGLWAVLASHSGGTVSHKSIGTANGALVYRTGVTDDCITGTDWQYTVGTGWMTVSCRIVHPT